MRNDANIGFFRRLSVICFVLGIVWDLFAAGPYTLFLDVLKTAPASFFVFFACLFLYLDARQKKDLDPVFTFDRFAQLLVLAFLFSVFPSSLLRLGYDRLYLSCVAIECIVISLFVYRSAKVSATFPSTIIYLLVGSLGILAVLGLLEQFGVILWTWNGGFQQIATLYMNPNLYSGILLLLLPFSAVLALTTARKSILALASLCCALGLVNLILAQSRASVLGFFIALVLCAVLYVVYFFKNRRRILIYVSGLLLLCLALLAVGAVMLPQFRQKIFSPFDFSGQSRLGAYQIAINLWLKTPLTALFGNGLGSFPELYFTEKPPFYRASPFMETWDAAHDEVLDRLVDGGIVGLVFFLVLIAFLLRSCLVVVKNPSLDKRHRITSLGCFFAIVASFVDSLLSTNSRVSFIQVVFAVVAGLAARVPPSSIVRPATPGPLNTVGQFIALILVPLAISLPQGARLLAERNMAQSMDTKLSSDKKELYIHQAVSADPFAVYPLYLEAYSQFSAERYSECIETAKLVRQHVANFKDIGLLQGAAAVGLNDLPTAKKYLDEYLARDQYDKKAEKYSIFVEYRLGDYKAAEARLEESMAGDFNAPETTSRYRIEFTDAATARREGDKLSLGRPVMLRSLAEIFGSSANNISVYFFRIDYLIGSIYEKAGLGELAVKRYQAAEFDFREALGPNTSQALSRTDNWPGYSVDSNLRASMIGRALRILESEIHGAAEENNASTEIEKLRQYLAYTSDSEKQERLAFLLAESWRFKELRAFQFATAARNSP